MYYCARGLRFSAATPTHLTDCQMENCIVTRLRSISLHKMKSQQLRVIRSSWVIILFFFLFFILGHAFNQKRRLYLTTRDKGVTRSLPQQLSSPLPVFLPPSSSRYPLHFSLPPFHLNTGLWARARWDLSAWKRSLNSNCQVRSRLASLHTLSLCLSFCSSPAWFTSERQQKVSALHLHVGSAFNKQNSSLAGHWERASAIVIWGDATTFLCPGAPFCYSAACPYLLTG